MTASDIEAAVDAALAATPRSDYLPADQRSLAGANRPLPIGGGQTNSQPQTVRNMLIALQVLPRQRVLDVGAGSGWSTVLLARLVGECGSVIGVERVAELIAWGASNVASADLPWAGLLAADPGVLGWPAGAPYDRIMVSAEARAVPAELVCQLATDGMMVIPVAGHLWRVRPSRPAQDLGRYAFVPLICGG